MCVEVRGQFAGINSCLALGGSNSGCLAWWEAPVSTKLNLKQVLKVFQLILEVLIFPSQMKTAPVALVFCPVSEHTNASLTTQHNEKLHGYQHFKMNQNWEELY